MGPKDPTRKPDRSPEKSALRIKKFKASNPDSPTGKTGNKLTEFKGQMASTKSGGARARQELFTDTGDVMEIGEYRDGPPQWFREFFSGFEERLERRFETLLTNKLEAINEKVNEQGEMIDGIKFDIQLLKEEKDQLWEKLDDLENRGRRNNLVFFKVPETDDENALNTVKDILNNFVGMDDQVDTIERCHRTPTFKSPNNPHPRPIHVAFNSHQIREKVRKACITKLKTQALYKGSKIFVAEDFSKRVQQMRKAKMPHFKRLQQEGKRPFFAYPAVIKYRIGDELRTVE